MQQVLSVVPIKKRKVHHSYYNPIYRQNVHKYIICVNVNYTFTVPLAASTVESLRANDYRVKMGSKTMTYHINMLNKYISTEPDADGNVVPVDATDVATIAETSVIQQDVNPELGEVPD